MHGTYSYSEDPEATIACLLEHAGPMSALSHRFAAHMHGFDLFEQRPRVELIVPFGSTFHPVISGPTQPAILVHRSRSLNPADIEPYLDSLTITNKARTLLDLSRYLTADELEMAVESALRSSDRFQPGAWDRGCFERLVELSGTHALGVRKLRDVLDRRPADCLPTGSPRETMLLQAARSVGHGDLHRQVTLTVVDVAARESITVCPDLGEFEHLGIALEYDGEEYHRDRRVAERRRDNLVGRVVHIVRFDSTTSKEHNAAQVLAAVRTASRRPWPDPRWVITRGDHEITITIPK